MEHNFTWKNDGRTKVMIGCGTRPEIIRLAAVIKRCREYFDCCVVYYNQNWDRNLSTVFWEDFELKNTFGEYGPDILVPVVGENLGVTCGNILGRSYELLAVLQPEGYLVLGDTNSCLSAISAKRLHIPLFHMEAGNRCKDECLPEETNRRIVDVISDVNMCYSEFARKYLADTGLPKERTYQTGSPMAEVLHMNLEKIQKSDVLERLGLEKDKYILLSAHREENIDSEKNFLSLFTAINALAEKYDMPILYSCHPRSRHRLEKSGFQLDPRVRVNEPLGFNDYNRLQMNALAIVSDSGTLPEESSFFTSVRVSAARALLWARYPSPGPMRRTVAFCRRMRGMLWGEMPPSAPGSQGQRQHSGRRAATAAITGSTLASVTMPAPVRRAPSTVSAAAPR